MRNRADKSALQGSKLTPNARNAIGAMLGARPIVLARATFATYQASLATAPIILSAYFNPGDLNPGDQFTAWVAGTASNNTGAPQQVGATVVATQGVTTQTIGATATAIDTTGTFVAWRSDIAFGVNVPGAAGQYTQPILPQVSNVAQAPRFKALGASLGFAGEGHTIITNTALTGAVYAGGLIISGTTASSLQATKAQITFSNAAPIRLDIILSGVTSGGVNWNVTVQAGAFLGL